MEAVKKAASGAVESIRNSPLFRRKFGTYQKAHSEPHSDDEEPRPISPEKDRSPFVQGIYFQVEYLGRLEVDGGRAQDHGCTDETVGKLWDKDKGLQVGGQAVTIRVTTSSMRAKRLSDGEVLFELPMFHVSYCGTDRRFKEAFTFVAKDPDGRFHCYVFSCANKDKAHAIALTVAKAFYLAYQILQQQQGQFPATPDREELFEPQHNDDTKTTPTRPTIPPPQSHLLETTDVGVEGATPPRLRVTRPSLASSGSEAGSLHSGLDDDFARLAKARSNPDILRSTLDQSDIRGTCMRLVHLHADPGSQVPTPLGSPHSSPAVSSENLREV